MLETGIVKAIIYIKSQFSFLNVLEALLETYFLQKPLLGDLYFPKGLPSKELGAIIG